MAETQAPTSKRALTFASGSLGRGSAGSPFAVAAIAAAILVDRRSVIFEPPGDSIGSIALIAFLVCIPFLTIGQRWIIEVDPVARRLTIFRLFLLRWTTIVLRTTVVEDCSFDECSGVGAIRHNDDEGVFYSVYLDFKRGGTHVIPVQNSSLSEAMRNATELATVTGIPRRDDIS
jgi:hypothetical protein